MPYWAVGFFHGLNLAVLDEPEMAFSTGPAVPDWLWAPTKIGYFFPAQIGCQLPTLTASNRKSIIHKNQKEWESHRTGIETATVLADRHSHQD